MCDHKRARFVSTALFKVFKACRCMRRRLIQKQPVGHLCSEFSALFPGTDKLDLLFPCINPFRIRIYLTGHGFPSICVLCELGSVLYRWRTSTAIACQPPRLYIRRAVLLASSHIWRVLISMGGADSHYFIDPRNKHAVSRS